MYVELHARSAFSFLEGASIPEELIAVCANFGMPAMALLDRDGVYGSPRFHLAAKRAKIKAHIGAEVTCAAFLPRRHGDTECRETSDSTKPSSCLLSWWISASVAGGFASWLSKSLPPDNENEIARWAQRGSLCRGSGFY
jgi:hypothetical protein